MTSPNPNPPGNILVRKYGGSSLADVERIQAVALDIRRACDQGYQVVVVVSAMGKTTDELADLAARTNPDPPRRELDMLLSVGERITMSLLSMALAREGCPAISYTGSQCGIITDGSHTDARIIEVRGDRVRDSLAQGLTVIVAGFQGVSEEKEITTLGRGGSDTTAVALAAALGAERCEILKDVPGVMSADPNLVPEAWRHERLSWDELRRIASSGCGVVHIRAVEYAAEHEVPLLVGSSFLVSSFKQWIPKQARISTFIIIIATFVTVADYTLLALVPKVHKELGAFIPLIVANCMILGRQEAFASKHTVRLAVMDAMGMASGFVIALFALGAIREILGSGALFGVNLFGSNFEPWVIMILPPGGFLTLGLILLFFNWFTLKKNQFIEQVAEAERSGI